MYRTKYGRRQRQEIWRGRSGSEPRPIGREAVAIGSLDLPGELVLVPDMIGLVLIAHGNSRRRGQYLASVLQAHRLGTLLFELLRPADGAGRLDLLEIDSLATRIGMTLDQIADRTDTARLQCGLLCAGTGAAAAFVAAAQWPIRVGAVVSPGGRPDLAAASLSGVHAPTLLIVGGADSRVLEFNRTAMRLLGGEKRLEVVPDAGHLFNQPGALESVAEMAAHWFVRHLPHHEAA